MNKLIFNKLNRININHNNGSVLISNPTSKTKFEVLENQAEFLLFLDILKKPISKEKILEKSKDVLDPDFIEVLIENKFIINFDKKLDKEYENIWEKHNWEDFIYYIETIGDYKYIDISEDKNKAKKIKEDVYKEYLENSSIDNYIGNSIFEDMSKGQDIIQLTDQKIVVKKNFFDAVFSRRTTRNFNYNKISQAELSWILKNSFYEIRNRKIKATNDITLSLSNFTNSHSLWLSAIVSINRVEGIPNGFYLYDYINNSLKLVKEGSSYEELQKVVIGQKFLFGSAFSVLISVDFHNIFWRYRYSGAYKSILITTAELAQKIITCAFSLDLGAFETPAIRDEQAESILHTKPFHEELMYYVAIGNYDRIKNYSQSAKYYDLMMGDRSLTIDRITSLIGKYNKKAKSILEVACGTGELLESLKDKYIVEGMDKSNDMLEIAKSKFPAISFMHGDMTKFYSDKKYDVVLCIFDSINHITEYEKWIDFFVVAKNSLNKNGILIFDINTLQKLEGMCTGTKSNQSVEGVDVQIEVENVGIQKYNWRLEFFDTKTKEKIFEENILEFSVNKQVVLQTLKKLFRKVDIVDFNAEKNNLKDKRLYFICTI